MYPCQALVVDQCDIACVTSLTLTDQKIRLSLHFFKPIEKHFFTFGCVLFSINIKQNSHGLFLSLPQSASKIKRLKFV